jgi:GTP cyclohydrolase II
VKRHLIALVGALLAVLAIVAGPAQAQSVQGVGQSAATGQSAESSASSTQTAPSNSNISVRIFSPGDGGSVSQSSTSVAGSIAGNKASTTQAVGQSQGGGGGGEQAVGQSAETGQHASSEAESKQYKPSNSNISVRIHSPGDDGDVSQSNKSIAGSAAGNLAETTQEVGQQQGGGEAAKSKCCGGGSGVQAVGQEAATGQKAESEAKSVQEHARNENIPVRIHSEGDNGSVTQSNDSVALSFAGNAASTEQAVQQEQAGGCGCASDLVQAVGQKAFTGQIADSDATSIQKGAKNSNTPVRIHSDGDDGDVEQSNNSVALSAAIYAAQTKQLVGQSQGGGCGCGDRKKSDGARVQAVGQWAETWQKADSDAKSEQLYPSNTNAPVREKSEGGGGSVAQSNNSLAGSLALNLARTLQGVRKEQ